MNYELCIIINYIPLEVSYHIFYEPQPISFQLFYAVLSYSKLFKVL